MGATTPSLRSIPAPRLSDRSLVATLVVTHGPLDALLTVAPLALLESTTIESNPLMTDVLVVGYWTALGSSIPMAVVAATIAVGMTAVVAGVGLLLWQLRSSVPGWRPFVALLAAIGFLNVVANAIILSTCSCS
jgi:hypothetical protein